MGKEEFDWSKWLPLFISVVAVVISLLSLFWNVFIEKRSKAKLEVWQRNHWEEDEQTEIELLFRNLSHRPTAIIDIYVREKDGGILGGQGYNNNIKLPIQIAPWEVIGASFRINKSDEVRMVDILVRDIEDNEIVVIRKRGKKWAK